MQNMCHHPSLLWANAVIPQKLYIFNAVHPALLLSIFSQPAFNFCSPDRGEVRYCVLICVWVHINVERNSNVALLEILICDLYLYMWCRKGIRQLQDSIFNLAIVPIWKIWQHNTHKRCFMVVIKVLNYACRWWMSQKSHFKLCYSQRKLNTFRILHSTSQSLINRRKWHVFCI